MITTTPFALLVALTLTPPTIAAVAQDADRDALLRALATEDRYCGMTKDQVLAQFGEPSEVGDSGNVWVCWHRLGPGAHSFRFGVELHFRDGRVVQAIGRRQGVGCILIYPAEGRGR